MPFQREWDRESKTYIINRDRTGAPKPVPSTGTAQATDGTIIADSVNLDVPPATPIRVTIPGINETVVDSRGRMSPRWWRFFEELYRRTGAIEDNINSTERLLGGGTTTGSMAFTGAAPVISRFVDLPVGSASFTGIAPSIVVGQTVPVASLTFTGNVPTIV
jgi:hypothetical protein